VSISWLDDQNHTPGDMNILMVIERYAPIWGGAENQLRQLAVRLMSRGCSISIITRRWDAEMARFEQVDGIDVHRVGRPGEGAAARLFFIAGLCRFALKKRNDIDIFHAHGAVKMGAIIAVLANLLGKKSVAKIATAGHVPVLQRRFFGRAVLYLFKRVDAVIAMTDQIISEMAAIGLEKKRIVQIANGIDCRCFAPLPPAQKSLMRHQHGCTEDELIFLFSGRLVRRKGIDTLIEAWSRWPSSVKPAILLIIGSGKGQDDSVEEVVRARVKNEGIRQVRFFGETDEPHRILPMADVFVFPSRLEGFPNALLEAMATALPVVGAAIGGVVDVVRDGAEGLLFEPDDASQLLAKMMQLAEDPALRARLGKNGRQAVCTRHSFALVTNEYVDLYERLLQPIGNNQE
jgi:glycosyltransferase involved in cell wall biosynthesis